MLVKHTIAYNCKQYKNQMCGAVKKKIWDHDVKNEREKKEEKYHEGKLKIIGDNGEKMRKNKKT